jgi:hypothetical protein
MEKRGAGFVKYKPWFFEIEGKRFGFEYSRVGNGTTPYLDRYIMYVGGISLRLHKFWRGDDDRAPHDHPWDFWTFPLSTYIEKVPVYGPTWKYPKYDYNYVKALRAHKREAKYRHIVTGRADGKDTPFWTLVLAGRVKNKWGFWPHEDEFVYWRDWA